jgi:hypothetical protein
MCRPLMRRELGAASLQTCSPAPLPGSMSSSTSILHLHALQTDKGGLNAKKGAKTMRTALETAPESRYTLDTRVRGQQDTLKTSGYPYITYMTKETPGEENRNVIFQQIVSQAPSYLSLVTHLFTSGIPPCGRLQWKARPTASFSCWLVQRCLFGTL